LIHVARSGAKRFARPRAVSWVRFRAPLTSLQGLSVNTRPDTELTSSARRTTGGLPRGVHVCADATGGLPRLCLIAHGRASRPWHTNGPGAHGRASRPWHTRRRIFAPGCPERDAQVNDRGKMPRLCGEIARQALPHRAGATGGLPASAFAEHLTGGQAGHGTREDPRAEPGANGWGVSMTPPVC